MTASAPWTAFPTVMVRANGDQVGSPDEVDVWIGLDVGKQEHFADVLDNDGEALFARSISNDEADLDDLLDRADEVGTPGLVIDQPGSIAQLAIAVAARRGVPVAYVPGLVMRRAADLYPGEAKIDRRDAFVIADTARLRRRQVHWLDVGNDELLEQRGAHGYAEPRPELEYAVGGAVWDALARRDGTRPRVDLTRPDVLVNAEVLGPTTLVAIVRRAWRDE